MNAAELGLRSRVLDQFEPEHATAIIEFSKHVSNLDADVIMFMARKSYCMYDLLSSLGFRPTQKIVLTDRILDQDLEALRGLRVALIDDTVILGTTLARAKAKLQAAGCEVEVHALCVNRETANRELSDFLDFSHIELEASDASTRILCANEVIAMGMMPRPYLVDFPISQQVKLDAEAQSVLASGISWQAHNLSTDLQAESNALIYTLLPLETERRILEVLLGSDIARCVDLAKVRLFGRRFADIIRATFVPIVTLRPLAAEDVDRLLDALIERFHCEHDNAILTLIEDARSPTARYRLAQYILSRAVGATFFRYLRRSGVIAPSTLFADAESHLHFGPWNRQALMNIGQAVEFGVSGETSTEPPLALNEHLGPAALPQRAATWMQTFLADGDMGEARLQISNSRPAAHTGIVEVDMAEMFLAMFERYELPARQEVQDRGVAAVQGYDAPTVFLDRLENGLAWREIVNHLCAAYHIPPSGAVRNLLSLSLDRLNDLGVAVPVVRCEEGIVYRAYRHGEDVSWHDAECDLAHEMCKGLIAQTQWQGIPSLVLEKSLVTLLRVGLAEKFLKGRPSATAAPPAAEVGYGLHGAVVRMRTRTAGTGRDSEWLRSYLVDRGVLTRDDRKRYALGEPTNATQTSRGALDRAFSIGALIGAAVARDPVTRGATDDDLVALTTCRTALSTLQAVDAELLIVRDWWGRRGRSLRVAELRTTTSAAGALSLLSHSLARTALRSAITKAQYWHEQRWRVVVDEVAERLAEVSIRDARDWQSLWRPDGESAAVAMEDRVAGSLTHELSLVWEWALDTAILEASLGVLAEETARAKTRLQNVVARAEHQAVTLRAAGVAAPRSFDPTVTQLRAWAKEPPSSEDAARTVRDTASGIETKLDVLDRAIGSTALLLAQYGRMLAVHRYDHVLWYDIVDSTGEQHLREFGDATAYRDEVSAFRQAVTDALEGLRIRCRKDRGDMVVWEGDIGSRNDSKNIAFTGIHSESWAIACLREIADQRLRHPHIRFRSILVDARFAGGELNRIMEDVTMEGDSFMEHLSRAQYALRELASDVESRFCPVLLLGDSVAKRENALALRLSNLSDESIHTQNGSHAVVSRSLMGMLPLPPYTFN